MIYSFTARQNTFKSAKSIEAKKRIDLVARTQAPRLQNMLSTIHLSGDISYCEQNGFLRIQELSLKGAPRLTRKNSCSRTRWTRLLMMISFPSTPA